MLGLALEGGAARGAYHIGVVKALMENGYEFDGFVGTSIGAINAAMLAQGDMDVALEVWRNITMEQIFDVEEQHILDVIEHGELWFNKEYHGKLRRAALKVIKGGGVDTAKIEALLSKYIDERKLRDSGKDFGLVTVAANRLKPYELMLDDIPQGELVDFVMASASIPGFRPKVIDEKKFLDGGIYNNCPVNLLLRNGYDRIIAIRTMAPGIVRKLDSEENVTVISPSVNLGNIMLFTQKNCEAGMAAGYNDGLRAQVL